MTIDRLAITDRFTSTPLATGLPRTLQRIFRSSELALCRSNQPGAATLQLRLIRVNVRRGPKTNEFWTIYQKRLRTALSCEIFVPR